MKNINLLFLIALLFTSCDDEMVIIDPEGNGELETQILLSIDGAEEVASFGCLNTPSLYSLGSQTDQTTGKFIFDQGYLEIPLASEATLVYKTILYTATDISSLNAEELKSYIISNPEELGVEITYTEDDLVYKNQFVDLSGLQALYEERNIVAENEEFIFTIGDINEFECTDEWPTIQLNAEYFGTLKTESESAQKDISIDIQLHLYSWR